jgi:hypothetical protein
LLEKVVFSRTKKVMNMLEEIVRDQQNFSNRIAIHAHISGLTIIEADAIFHQTFPVLYGRLFPGQPGNRGAEKGVASQRIDVTKRSNELQPTAQKEKLKMTLQKPGHQAIERLEQEVSQCNENCTLETSPPADLLEWLPQVASQFYF